jgi:hypothetical protein
MPTRIAYVPRHVSGCPHEVATGDGAVIDSRGELH